MHNGQCMLYRMVGPAAHSSAQARWASRVPDQCKPRCCRRCPESLHTIHASTASTQQHKPTEYVPTHLLPASERCTRGLVWVLELQRSGTRWPRKRARGHTGRRQPRLVRSVRPQSPLLPPVSLARHLHEHRTACMDAEARVPSAR